MKTLSEILKVHKKGDWPDKGSVHSYIEIYEIILESYRGTAKNILEIGLMSGESLRMWSDYFMGVVYGMDCDIKPVGGMADLTRIIGEGFRVMIGDASNTHDIDKYFKGIKFDVVIEDANHTLEQQLQIYSNLKPYMADGSIYIIEDIQDLSATEDIFLNIAPDCQVTIFDNRYVKGRYDDVIVTIKNLNPI